MSTALGSCPHSSRSVFALAQALRQCRLELQQSRGFAEVTTASTEVQYKPAPKYDWQIQLQARERVPRKIQPSQAINQNRVNHNLNKIKVYPSKLSAKKVCKDPIAKITKDQLSVLDPTGLRFKLFDRNNRERAQPGDILLVRLKSGEPFSGVCLSIRRVHSRIDWAILLRNHLTRLPVEMWFKVFSPNIEGIEIVQRRPKRARRARLYYMRKAKHDLGSVDGVVREYLRNRAAQIGGKSKKKAPTKK